MTTSPTTISLLDKTCHALPCNMDYEGMAATHLYFHPIRTNTGMARAMFRGRGLLAIMENDNIPSHKMALLEVDGQSSVVKTKVPQMDRLLEWQHEHNPTAARLEAESSSSPFQRSQQAQSWLQVAQALHDPIPLAATTTPNTIPTSSPSSNNNDDMDTSTSP